MASLKLSKPARARAGRNKEEIKLKRRRWKGRVNSVSITLAHTHSLMHSH